MSDKSNAYDVDEYISAAKAKLSDKRFYHSMCVAEKAVELAKKYNQDENKAYVAGILHDIMKDESFEAQRNYVKKIGAVFTSADIMCKPVFHQLSGSFYIQLEFGINDVDIINAVRFHSTGRANMTEFEMIIYLADITSKDRDYPDIDVIRRKVDESLLDGMLYSLKYTINHNVSQNKVLHPNTLFCYNWVVEKMQKEC